MGRNIGVISLSFSIHLANLGMIFFSFIVQNICIFSFTINNVSIITMVSLTTRGPRPWVEHHNISHQHNYPYELALDTLYNRKGHFIKPSNPKRLEMQFNFEFECQDGNFRYHVHNTNTTNDLFAQQSLPTLYESHKNFTSIHHLNTLWGWLFGPLILLRHGILASEQGHVEGQE